jgi:flavin reductase (DIM6/NTAB) family NADH-FMN oxidoreductase RutF
LRPQRYSFFILFQGKRAKISFQQRTTMISVSFYPKYSWHEVIVEKIMDNLPQSEGCECLPLQYMISIDPKKENTAAIHAILLGAVAPRPIALASTLDKDGNPNLSPFSFYNTFGASPPILVFSPARRIRDNTTKHTLDNARDTGEVVINAVTYDMVQQTSLASTEYEKGVNEFLKAGFTPVPSLTVKPFRVGESPVQFECSVKQIIETGSEGGAGNLVVCEIRMIHIHEKVFKEGKIDHQSMDLVGRLGGDWYCRAHGDALFEVEKPLARKGIGIDNIPEPIRNSRYLTGNDLGRLGNIESLPSKEEIESFRMELENLKQEFADHENVIHAAASHLIEANRIWDAWKALLSK